MLGTIRKDAPIEADPAAYLRQPGDPAAAAQLLAALEMHKLVDRWNAWHPQDCAKAALYQSQASVRYLAVGLLADVAAIRRASLALHTHARVVVLQADVGAAMQLKHLHGFTLARFGKSA